MYAKRPLTLQPSSSILRLRSVFTALSFGAMSVLLPLLLLAPLLLSFTNFTTFRTLSAFWPLQAFRTLSAFLPLPLALLALHLVLAPAVAHVRARVPGLFLSLELGPVVEELLPVPGCLSLLEVGQVETGVVLEPGRLRQVLALVTVDEPGVIVGVGELPVLSRVQAVCHGVRPADAGKRTGPAGRPCGRQTA